MIYPRPWAVVETRPNQEGIAERSLLQLAYAPLVIRYNKLLKGRRIEHGRRIHGGKDSLVERPFIPGYLFLPLEYGDDAMLADADHGIGKPRGVKRVLRNRIGDDGRARPKLIRASIVEQIRAAALERDETPRQVRQDLREALASGRPAVVRDRLGLTMTLLSLDDQGRARYLMEILGREICGTVEDTSELELMEA